MNERISNVAGATPPTRPAVRARFRWHWISLVFVFGIISAAIWRYWAKGDPEITWVSGAMGAAVAGMILPALLGWAGYYAARLFKLGRNPSLFGNIIFCVTACIPILGLTMVGWQTWKGRNRADVLRQVDAANAALKTIEPGQVGQVGQNNSTLLAQSGKTLIDAGKKLKGDEGLMIQADGVFASVIGEAFGKYNQIVDQATQENMLSLRQNLTQTDITRRIEVLDNINVENQQMISAIKGMNKTIADRLQAGGTAADKAAEIADRYLRNLKPDDLLAIRACDVELFEAMKSSLELLQRHKGQWTFQTQERAFEFASDSVAVEFNQLQDKMRAAGERQIKLQEKVQKRSHNTQVPTKKSPPKAAP